MLEATKLVEKTILGDVICEETTADDATSGMDEAAEIEADVLENELSPKLIELLELLKLLAENSEVDEVALVI